VRKLFMEGFFRFYLFLDKRKSIIIAIGFIGTFLWGLWIYYDIYKLSLDKAISYALGLFAVDVKVPDEITNAFADNNTTLVKSTNDWMKVYTVSIVAKFVVLLTILLIYIRDVLSFFYQKLIIRGGEHTIIIGLGRNSRFFIDSMLEKFPHKLITFETDKENPYLDKYKNKRVSIVVKDVEKMIDDLNLDEVKNIFISTGNDRQNIYYALQFLERLEKNDNFGKLLVHIEDRTLRNLYSDKGTLDSHGIEMNVFSFYKESARMLFWKYALDGSDDEIITSSKPFTINIIGADDLTVSLVVEASKLAHYPKGNHLYINVIAKDTSSIQDKLEFAFPEMGKIKNIHITYIDLDDTTIEFYKPNHDIWNSINLKHVFFCYDDITRNIRIATKVSNYTYLRRKEEAKAIKFHIATLNHKRIAKKLNASQHQKNLSIFAQAEDVCSYKNLLDNDIDTIAKMIHYDYCKETLNKGETLESEDKEWKNALINDKKSSIGQAIHISTKLKYLGLTVKKDNRGLSVKRLEELNSELLHKMLEIRKINNARVLDELVFCEHNRWMALLMLMDYQYKDIPKKDKPQRLHPLLKPFNTFSIEERDKHLLYSKNALFKIANYQARLGNILTIKLNDII